MTKIDDGMSWGTDVPISLPVPPDNNVLIDFGGFGFTQYGLAHQISQTNIEEFIPTFFPSDPNE